MTTLTKTPRAAKNVSDQFMSPKTKNSPLRLFSTLTCLLWFWAVENSWLRQTAAGISKKPSRTPAVEGLLNYPGIWSLHVFRFLNWFCSFSFHSAFWFIITHVRKLFLTTHLLQCHIFFFQSSWEPKVPVFLILCCMDVNACQRMWADESTPDLCLVSLLCFCRN